LVAVRMSRPDGACAQVAAANDIARKIACVLINGNAGEEKGMGHASAAVNDAGGAIGFRMVENLTSRESTEWRYASTSGGRRVAKATGARGGIGRFLSALIGVHLRPNGFSGTGLSRRSKEKIMSRR
jgi:hypothetical protein